MFKRFIAALVCLTFIASYYQPLYAQDFSIAQLPVPGSMISVTPAYVPLTLKGLIIHPENALKFDFLMDTGYSHLKGNDLSDEAMKIMKYFLTALTISEDDLWVNLSPYEKGRTIQRDFGQTMMGRDLLAQDYVLKQLTSSLIYPDKALGKEFWQKVYSKAAQEFGSTQIPVNTFNKVWIVPSEAVVWEHEGKVFIVRSHLKVMLEEDYLALRNNINHIPSSSASILAPDKTHSLASQITRSIVLPVLEKEVNEGKNFAQLRQMFQAMILATWYKKALRKSILNRVYTDKEKLAGIGYKNSSDVELIYRQYLKAFRKGAFNLIKEDIDPFTGQSVPRKYFSGGVLFGKLGVTALILGLTILSSNKPPADIFQKAGDTIDVAAQVEPASAPRAKLSLPVPVSKEQKRDSAMFSLKSLLFGNSNHGGNGNGTKNEIKPAAAPVPLVVAAPPPSPAKPVEAPVQAKVRTVEDLIAIRYPNEDDVREMGETHNPLAVDRLIELSKSPNSDISRNAIVALGEIEDPKVEPALLEVLNNPAIGERSVAAYVLGNRGGETAKTGLLEASKKDLDRELRERIAIALGKIAIARGKKGDQSVTEDLRKFLKELPGFDQDLNVSSENFSDFYFGIAQALIILGHPQEAAHVLPRLLRNPVLHNKVLQELVTIGEVAVPDLLQMLGSNEYKDIEPAKEALVRIGKPAIPGVLAVFKAHNVKMIRRALLVLNDMGWEPDIVKKVSGRVGDVTKAMIAISDLKEVSVSPEDYEELMIYYTLKKEWERLGEAGKPASVLLLEALGINRGYDTGHEYENNVLAIISALGQTAEPAAVPELFKLTGDSEEKVMGSTRVTKQQVLTYDAAIEFALLNIGEPAIPEILKGKDSKNHYVVRMAEEILGEIHHRKIFPVSRKGANAVVESLKLLRNDDPYVRKKAAIALGLTKNEGAIEPLLIRLMSDRDKDVARACADSILKIGGYEHADVLGRLLDRDPKGAYASLFRYINDAIRWKLEGEGFDFKVSYIEGGVTRDYTNQEGVERSHLSEESLKIYKGDKLTERAMLPKPADEHLGGIALNANMLDLQVKHVDNAMSLAIGQEFLDKINFQGLVPRIISIHSISLPSLVGTIPQNQ